MSKAMEALIESFAILDRRRDQAEEAISAALPVCFACWDCLESGIPAGALANRLGVTAERVMLLAEVADCLIDQREARMGP